MQCNGRSDSTLDEGGVHDMNARLGFTIQQFYGHLCVHERTAQIKQNDDIMSRRNLEYR